MAKNFPYFKFTATEWLTGDIVFEDFELQGIFINVCALYWHRDGKISLDEIQKRLKTERLAELSDRFFSVKDGLISVNFLDEQLISANHISKTNSNNGKKGGRPKALKTVEEKPTAKRPLSEVKPKKSKEEKEEEKEEEINKNIFSFKKSLLNLGASQLLVNDWLLVRKNKKATNTETAFNNFKSEIEKTKIDINKILEICVSKSWSGFKAEWIKDEVVNLGKKEYTLYSPNGSFDFKLTDSELEEKTRNGYWKIEI